MVENKKKIKKSKGDDLSLIAKIDLDNLNISDEDLEKELPILPLRNMVIFPDIVMPVAVGRKSSLELVNHAYKKKSLILLATQIDAGTEYPGFDDLYKRCVIGRIIRIIELPGGNINVLINTCGPTVELTEITSTSPFLMGNISRVEEDVKIPRTNEFKATMDTCYDVLRQLSEYMEDMAREFIMAIKEMENDKVRINFICSNFPFDVKIKQELLKANNVQTRAIELVEHLYHQLEYAKLKHDIQMRTREELDKQQREYYLQQQLKNIQEELGNGAESEIDNLRTQGKAKHWSKDVAEIFEKELTKLERINSQSPDYNVQYTYLQNLLALPWNVFSAAFRLNDCVVKTFLFTSG